MLYSYTANVVAARAAVIVVVVVVVIVVGAVVVVLVVALAADDVVVAAAVVLVVHKTGFVGLLQRLPTADILSWNAETQTSDVTSDQGMKSRNAHWIPRALQTIIPVSSRQRSEMRNPSLRL